jgi:DNA modification methylase
MSPSRTAIGSSQLESAHRMHSYSARFPSEIAVAAVKEYSRRNESIYDPFCGSGTSLTAGLTLGRRVVGSDIDVLAGMISSIKCVPSSADSYDRWLRRFEKRLDNVFYAVKKDWPPIRLPSPGETLEVGGMRLPIPSLPELNYWFPPQLIALLAAIAAEAHKCSDEHMEQVALVSLSASIISKWPNTLSYAMDVDHTRPHRVLQRFTSARVLEIYRNRLNRTIKNLVLLRTLYEGAGIIDRLIESSKVISPHDAREEAAQILSESQSLIVTSPPYLAAIDYPRAHRLSVCWMNGRAPLDLTSRKKYIGIRHAGQSADLDWLDRCRILERFIPPTVRSGGRLSAIAGFFADLEAATVQMWRVLRPGGHAVVVIADNKVDGHRVRAHAAFAEIAQQLGFHLVSRRSREIHSGRRRFPVGPFGFDGPMTHEYVVVVRRPRVRASAKVPIGK